MPNPPQNITVTSKGSRVVNISWTAGFDGNSGIQNYTVEISEDNQTFRETVCQGSLLSSACAVSAPSASLESLLPWTSYYVRVFARNIAGSSSGSSVVNFTTDEEGKLVKEGDAITKSSIVFIKKVFSMSRTIEF